MTSKVTLRAAAALVALAGILAACDAAQQGTTQDRADAAQRGVSENRAGLSATAPQRLAASPQPASPFIAGENRERYQALEENTVKQVAEAPVSTFSVDVDTGSYSNVRRLLESGTVPPHDAVRIEELVNYITYDYQGPRRPEQPFAVNAEVARTPWNADTYLLRIGIRGYDIERAERPPANLVFLVDGSGSMASEDKLPLVVKSLRMLTRQLTAEDRISIVVYAGAAGMVLEPTPGDHRAKIFDALGRLEAGGRTAGEAGIKLAYELAEANKIDGGINRVILATDGDFNVGVSDVRALKDLIVRKRKSGITLTTLGFGTGNYNEALMEQMADVGNGNYAYIDRLSEARKVLVNEMDSTLFTIAKDVKIQIEFNPAVVAEYRLIGFENRLLKREDFNTDRVDAGDIGAGHTVTALYEIALADSAGRQIEPLRYAVPKRVAHDPRAKEFAFLKLRYKLPDEDDSRLIEEPLARSMIDGAGGETSDDFRFAACVAAFGQLLRGGRYTNGYSYDDVAALARRSRGEDRHGYRAQFLTMVDLAKGLDGS